MDYVVDEPASIWPVCPLSPSIACLPMMTSCGDSFCTIFINNLDTARGCKSCSIPRAGLGLSESHRHQHTNVFPAPRNGTHQIGSSAVACVDMNGSVCAHSHGGAKDFMHLAERSSSDITQSCEKRMPLRRSSRTHRLRTNGDCYNFGDNSLGF